MSKLLDVFCEIPCLTEQSVSLDGLALQKKWFKSADKRIIGQYLQKFINYNLDFFNFLGVQPSILGVDQNISINFRSSQYIGVIPLRASDTGKQIGDFVVAPRYSSTDRFEEYIEILNLLNNEISPEFINSLPLASGKNFRPPLYLEAVLFLAELENLLKTSWRKFDSQNKLTSEPKGQVNWTTYINDSYKIENTLKFPVRKNILSEFHEEFSQIRFVFDICKNELISSNTPQKLKIEVIKRINYIEERLYFHKPVFTNSIQDKTHDSPAVKACKKRANNILKYNFTKSIAWRVDFADVFEKFVQHIFKQVAKETGAKLFTNHKFQAYTSTFYSWELKHIEPDAIYKKGDFSAFIDAKYKSNLYNKFSLSESLKEIHRQDLHQILAYSSFSNISFKYGFLCYPSNQVEFKKIEYRNALNNVKNIVFVLGIPLKTNIIPSAKKLIREIFSEIEIKELNQNV